MKRRRKIRNKSKKQSVLLDSFVKTKASEEWVDMPEFICKHEPKPKASATIMFDSEKDLKKFEALLKEHGIFDKNKSLFSKGHDKKAWYPQKSKSTDYIYSGDHNIPTTPIYIVSRGRWETRYTADLLESMGIKYYMVVRDDEYKKYKKAVQSNGTVLSLPKKYIDDYDVFWKDNDDRTGPGPSRNFAWDHSIEAGDDHHFVMDDNIEAFMRFNNNLKIKCKTGSMFVAMENFVNRYENIALAAPHYSFFIAEKQYYPPYVANTRVMSCILIKNDIPFRWRGRYSEDIDLSLRVLKAGLCTVQFNAFLQRKLATQVLKGGNTEEFYENEGTYLKSKMLAEMHPDVARITKRYGRDHHYVDYRTFKGNKLKKINGFKKVKGQNEFGMVLKKV